ncbi:MAG TPA: SAM-dependent methyltransferase [Trebonia sp.]|jgi:hypothetical protein|nr:SAM-dependent methyltransferase [Trebonia sp.]
MGKVPGPRNELDMSRPSVARVYDYLLGGKNNVAADRAVAARITDPARGWPGVRDMARENRVFIGKAVTWLASRGVGQYLDLGSGLPPPGPYLPVHVAAREHVPDARVVYVDTDPVVLSYVRSLQATSEGVAATGGDIARPRDVLASSVVRACVSTAEPACVILGAVLHFFPPDRAREIVAEFMEPFPEGSAAIISVTRIGDQALLGRLAGGYASTASWWNHSRGDVEGWFAAAGLTVVRNDVADVRCWPMPPGEPRAGFMLGGVGLRES